jgi:ParB family chromosome partitioning protein
VVRIREKRLIKVKDMVPSARNVRTGERGGIPELAEQIYAQSLLHAPTVVPKIVGKGKKARTVYETDAGERRRLAMLLLIKDGRWPSDAEIEANIAEVTEGAELSLSENVGAEPMSPADAYMAFRNLIEREGKSVAEVAERFGIKEITVRRRMKLANVAPELFQAYRDGEMETAQIMALAVVDDHDAQVRVWNQAPSWQRDPAALRGALVREECSTRTDLVASWVGADAYEQAGGIVRRDLFSDSGEAFILDRELLDRVATDQLQAVAASVKAEGWKWVEVRARMSKDALAGFGRCPQEQREPTADEDEQIGALEQRIEKIGGLLEAYCDGAIEDDEEQIDQEKAEALEAESDECTAQLQRLEDGLLRWNDDMVAHAGAVVTIARGANAEAVVVVHRGLVVPEDREALNEAAVASGLAPVPASDRISGRPSVSRSSAPRPEFSEALMQRLTAHRTIALQATIANSPQVAVALLVEKLLSEWCKDYVCERTSCLKVSAANAEYGLTKAADDIEECEAWRQVEAKKDAWTQRLAKARGDDGSLLQVLLELPLLDLHELLALCIAVTLDTVQARHQSGPADALAQVVGLDMADWWTPTARGFLSHVPKAKLVEAVMEGVSVEAARPLDAMKKAGAVDEAERLLAASRWLPSPLRSAPFELVPQVAASADAAAGQDGSASAGATAEAPVTREPATADVD